MIFPVRTHNAELDDTAFFGRGMSLDVIRNHMHVSMGKLTLCHLVVLGPGSRTDDHSYECVVPRGGVFGGIGQTMFEVCTLEEHWS